MIFVTPSMLVSHTPVASSLIPVICFSGNKNSNLRLSQSLSWLSYLYPYGMFALHVHRDAQITPN